MDALENEHPNNEVSHPVAEANPTENAFLPMEDENESLFGEVGEMAKYLNEMLGKIQSAESVMESVSEELPLGTDQISEVNRSTEEAMQKILDDTEKINENHEQMSTQLDSLKATLFDESLRAQEKVKADVKELCQLIEGNKEVMFNLVGTLSFQDPAGQKLRKVSQMLQALQSRMLKAVITFGKKVRGGAIPEKQEEELLSELEYSSEGEAVDQDLVDSVLKGYGF